MLEPIVTVDMHTAGEPLRIIRSGAPEPIGQTILEKRRWLRDNVEGGAYFSEKPFSEDALACSASGGAEGNCDVWDITQFAWVGGPWPGGQTTAYRSDSGNNPYGFQNLDFDARADECDATVDDAERAACYNELNEYVTTLNLDPEQGLFMLPLTQKPSFYGYTADLATAGVAPDAQGAGPLTNVVDFSFAG